MIWLSVLLSSSCSELIDLKTDDSEPVVVIYGTLSEQEVYQTIRVTLSSPYFEVQSNKPLSNAVVTIQTSNFESIDFEETEEKGVYRTQVPYAAVPGVTYHLSVLIDPQQSGTPQLYEASATMQRPYDVDSISMEVRNLMGFKYYTLNLYAMDAEGPDFYYAYPVINNTLIDNRISRLSVFSDFGFDNQYINGFPIMQFEDYQNEGLDEEDSGYFIVKPGDKITLCISLIDKGYHDFLEQAQNERRGENPFFGGPASNIATNISNGGVGYFAAFCTTKIETQIP
jgi:hypothetical protein